MTRNDFNRGYEKRQRIGETTLIMGLDIGCEFNMMCMMNAKGKVLGEHKVYNSRKGFDFFKDVVDSTVKKEKLWDVLIGFEPTGTYWRKIIFYAKELGYEVRFVRTTALKHQRELDESAPLKTDKRDAYTIANITREGKYLDSEVTDGVYRELRSLANLRESIVRENTRSKNAVRTIIVDFFPELLNFFSKMSGKALLLILETCPFPADILSYGEKRLAELISKSSRNKKIGETKSHKIFEAAKESIGLKNVGSSDRMRLAMCLRKLKQSEVDLQEIESGMINLTAKIPQTESIHSIPGAGMASTGIILGEFGDLDNFRGAAQAIKYAGYDPTGKESGKHIGKRRISKKGRWRLRKALYLMSMRVVRAIPEFREYYERKIEGDGGSSRKLARKEALCAVAIKLIKLIFSLCRDRRKYENREKPELLAA
jgi:transposase